jgi:uncharacterized membrane protein
MGKWRSPGEGAPDKAVEGLRQYGGTVLKSSLSKETEAELQDALHGEGSNA